MIRFRVYGQPKAQPRARAFSRGGHARVYNPSTAEGWKGLIALEARKHAPAAPLSGPIVINATFLFARPKNLLRKKDPDGRIPHTNKPDRDNLDKAMLDTLTQIGLLADDALVYAGTIRKYWVARGEAEGAEIEIVTEPLPLPEVPREA